MDPNAFLFMALSGEQQFGASSGAVIVNAEAGHAKFTTLAEVEPPTLREALRGQLKDHPDMLFVLNKTAQHIHVFSSARDKALEQLKNGTLPKLT